MKRGLTLSISLLLSALILLGGSGLIVGKMVCLESGRTIFTAGAASGCCAKKTTAAAFESNCCRLQNTVFTQSDFMPQATCFLKTFPLSSVLLHEFSFASVATQSFENSAAIPKPPLLRKNSSQSFLAVFRV
jgi:hypothetical protein